MLSATRDELISRVDVEEETIDDILKILAAEFNEDASDVEEEPVAEETEEETEEAAETDEQLEQL